MHFSIFFTLYCNFFYLNLHFYVFFTLVCDFLSLKFTFFWLFSLCDDFFSSKFTFLINFFYWKFNLNVSRLVKYDPMRASSYLSLPKELNAKRGCLIIQNNDEKCFLWLILASLHPVQRRNHPDRVAKYQEFESELTMSGVKYPVDMKILTNLNTKTTLVLMSVDVKIKKSSRYVLLPWALQDIAWIYYISPLVKHVITYCWKTWADWYQDKIVITTTKNISGNIVYMTKSVKRYWEKNILERCKLHRAQRIKLPEANNKKERNKVKPIKTEYQLRLPFVIYADFKSVLPKQDSCGPLSSKSFITQYQHHVPYGSCIYMKCNDGQSFKPHQVNIGDDAAEKYLEQYLALATICRQHLANNIPMKRLTQEQWREYNNATNYSICTKPFKSKDKKVRDHDHLTGKCRGPAYNAWNLNYQYSGKK